MSSSAAVVFVGLRFELDPGEIEALETRSDPRLVAARRNGLNHYWGNFATSGEKWLLLIGTKVGVIGPEGQDEVHLTQGEISRVFADTGDRLRQAGLPGVPMLHMQLQPDS